MNYYQHHIGDYRRDTAHLSLLEHGAYRQLLDMYYLSEEKIPEETEVVMRRLCARTNEEKSAVVTVLNEFFFLSDGWSHKRCDSEISAYHDKADRARNNGKLGGRPSKTKEVISDNPEETQTKANHKPLTINHKPLTTNKNIPASPKQEYPEAFDATWKLYPSRPGASKKEAFKAWSARLKAGVDAFAMEVGVAKYAAYVAAMQTEPNYIKQPATFFGPGEHYKADWTVPQAANQKQSRHSGFENINYSEGIEDGRIL